MKSLRRQRDLRLVAGVIEPAAELQGGMRPRHLFIHEGSRAVLSDGRREGLGAGRGELAVQVPAADAAHQRADLAMREQQLAFHRLVVERRADRSAFQFLVLVTAEPERGAIRLQQSVHLVGAGAGAQRVTPRREADLAAFDDRDAVLAVGVAVAGAGVGVLAGPGPADAGGAHARLRVLHFPFGRGVVAHALPAAAEVKRPLTIADMDVAGAAGLAAVGAEVEREVAGCPGGALGWDLVGDDVDEPADRVGAVEQRGGPAHDLDLVRGGRIHRHAVIAGLAGEIAHALAVFEHHHTVAVEPADDGTGRRRAERAGGDPGLRLQCRANRALDLLGQLLPGQHRGRLIRLELRPRRGAHRQHFGKVQIEFDRHVEAHRLRGDGDFGTSRGVALGPDADVIAAGRHTLERVVAFRVGSRLEPQLVDHHQGTGHRLTALALRDRPAYRRALLLGRGGHRPGHQRQRDKNERNDRVTHILKA